MVREELLTFFRPARLAALLLRDTFSKYLRAVGKILRASRVKRLQLRLFRLLNFRFDREHFLRLFQEGHFL